MCGGGGPSEPHEPPLDPPLSIIFSETMIIFSTMKNIFEKFSKRSGQKIVQVTRDDAD